VDSNDLYIQISHQFLIIWNMFVYLQEKYTMKRKISKALAEWKNQEGRMPLIINGARQVGKTYILEQFGKEHFDNVLYLNMEIEGALCRFFETELDPKEMGHNNIYNIVCFIY
jgi:hypothetical protein